MAEDRLESSLLTPVGEEGEEWPRAASVLQKDGLCKGGSPLLVSKGKRLNGPGPFQFCDSLGAFWLKYSEVFSWGAITFYCPFWEMKGQGIYTKCT